MTKIYRFTGLKSQIQFDIEFTERYATNIKIWQPEKWSSEHWGWFTQHVLFNFQRLYEPFLNDLKTVFKIELLPSDLSFEAFWEAYGNKVGKKKRSEELWKLLSEADKQAALMGVKKYKNWKAQNPSVQMLYPETFLSQRRFENEF
jgi:hypothetical protein